MPDRKNLKAYLKLAEKNILSSPPLDCGTGILLNFINQCNLKPIQPNFVNNDVSCIAVIKLTLCYLHASCQKNGFYLKHKYAVGCKYEDCSFNAYNYCLKTLSRNSGYTQRLPTHC